MAQLAHSGELAAYASDLARRRSATDGSLGEEVRTDKYGSMALPFSPDVTRIIALGKETESWTGRQAR